MAGNHDHPEIAREFFQAPESCDPIHAGHLNIQEDKVDIIPVLLVKTNNLDTVASRYDLDTRSLQHF